jgi:hypothetical protein
VAVQWLDFSPVFRADKGISKHFPSESSCALSVDGIADAVSGVNDPTYRVDPVFRPMFERANLPTGRSVSKLPARFAGALRWHSSAWW